MTDLDRVILQQATEIKKQLLAATIEYERKIDPELDAIMIKLEKAPNNAYSLANCAIA